MPYELGYPCGYVQVDKDAEVSVLAAEQGKTVCIEVVREEELEKKEHGGDKAGDKVDEQVQGEEHGEQEEPEVDLQRDNGQVSENTRVV